MAFSEPFDLLRLAEVAAARHMGVSLEQNAGVFGASRRAAQRSASALTHDGRWRVREAPLSRLAPSGEEALDGTMVEARRCGSRRRLGAKSLGNLPNGAMRSMSWRPGVCGRWSRATTVRHTRR